MSDVRDLYQEVILDHNKNPLNFRKPAGTNRQAEGYNPLCGDHIDVFLEMQGDTVKDIGFQGSGCAISRASASMMTGSVKGKDKAYVKSLFEKFHAMITADMDKEVSTEGLGKLAVFDGVREYPARVKCASLAWHTLNAALESPGKVVSTESEKE